MGVVPSETSGNEVELQVLPLSRLARLLATLGGRSPQPTAGVDFKVPLNPINKGFRGLIFVSSSSVATLRGSGGRHEHVSRLL